jgi:uncharacterized coiled-coil DUF342 family protein
MDYESEMLLRSSLLGAQRALDDLIATATSIKEERDRLRDQVKELREALNLIASESFSRLEQIGGYEHYRDATQEALRIARAALAKTKE